MPDYVTSVIWLVLSSVAAINNIVSAISISHYLPFYHGTDILLFSSNIASMLNVMVIPTIPAVIHLSDYKWNSMLCQVYVWAFITFRVLQVSTLICLAVMWDSILRRSIRNNRSGLTGTVKYIVVAIWLLACVIGALPIIGAVPNTFHTGKVCKFMGAEFGHGFVLFMSILVFSSFFVVGISLSDSFLLMKYIRRVALLQYGAGRFHVPNKRASVPGSGTYSVHERYKQLDFAWKLLRLVLVWSSCSFSIHHVPYAVCISPRFTSKIS